MHVTRQTNHALRILMHCARRRRGLSKVAAIADEYGISEAYLFKIVPLLVAGGVVETVRGRGGGIRLARDAGAITVGEIVRLTEDRLALAECFEDPSASCPLLDTCRLRCVWSEALAAFLAVLDGYTLADLVPRDGTAAVPLRGLDLGLAS